MDKSFWISEFGIQIQNRIDPKNHRVPNFKYVVGKEKCVEMMKTSK